jgi:hypothetical protein
MKGCEKKHKLQEKAYFKVLARQKNSLFLSFL